MLVIPTESCEYCGSEDANTFFVHEILFVLGPDKVCKWK